MCDGNGGSIWQLKAEGPFPGKEYWKCQTEAGMKTRYESRGWKGVRRGSTRYIGCTARR